MVEAHLWLLGQSRFWGWQELVYATAATAPLVAFSGIYTSPGAFAWLCWFITILILVWNCFLRHVIGNPSRHNPEHCHGFPKDIIALADDGARNDIRKHSEATEGSPWKDLTDEELKLLQFIFAITFKLGYDDPDAVADAWRMVGGGKPLPNAPEQLSFTALRYHLSFTAYATAALCMRTPCLRNQAREVLRWIMHQLLDVRVFGYSTYYWKQPEKNQQQKQRTDSYSPSPQRPKDLKKGGSNDSAALSPNPFYCRENIMWTGHVLHVAALYEVFSGDDRFRRKKGLKVVDAEGQIWYSDVETLALHLAACMRINRTGGVPCEPGLVFFQCQNHPMCGLRILESPAVGAFPSGFFRPERRRFLRFALTGMRAVVGTGGLKIAVVTTVQHTPAFDAAYARELKALEQRRDACSTAASSSSDGVEAERVDRIIDESTPPGPSPSRIFGAVPFAHLGSDGWDLTYLHWWADSCSVVTEIYRAAVKPKVVAIADHYWECRRCNDDDVKIHKNEAVDGKLVPSSLPPSSSSPPPPIAAVSAPPSPCCAGLNIPQTAWTSQLLPLLVQTGDLDLANRAENWLVHRCRRSFSCCGNSTPFTSVESGTTTTTTTAAEKAVKRSLQDCVWLHESDEWAVGNTANYALSQALRNGSEPRHLHHYGLSLHPPSWTKGEEQPLTCMQAARSTCVAVLPIDTPIFRCRLVSQATTSATDSGITIEIGIVFGTPGAPSEVTIELLGAGDFVASSVTPSADDPATWIQPGDPGWTWKRCSDSGVSIRETRLACVGQKPHRRVALALQYQTRAAIHQK